MPTYFWPSSRNSTVITWPSGPGWSGPYRTTLSMVEFGNIEVYCWAACSARSSNQRQGVVLGMTIPLGLHLCDCVCWVWGFRSGHGVARGSELDAITEAAARLGRDQRFVGAGLDLLHGPGVPVGIAETEEGSAVTVVEDGDLAGLDAAVQQFMPGCCRVGD